MRPILLNDIEMVAQHIEHLPERERKQAVLDALWKAEAADRYRKKFRCAHPQWGSGCLCDVFNGKRRPESGPIWDQRDKAIAIRAVLAAIVDWRDAKAVSGPGRMTGI